MQDLLWSIIFFIVGVPILEISFKCIMGFMGYPKKEKKEPIKPFNTQDSEGTTFFITNGGIKSLPPAPKGKFDNIK